MNPWSDEGWWREARHCPSPNHGPRPLAHDVSLLVVHNISLPPGVFGGAWVEALFLNTLPTDVHPSFASLVGVQVSAHFLIARDGRVTQFVAGDRRAWHAGQSIWQGRANCNDYSIGVELEGTDDQPFEAEQYAALWRLMDALRQRYPIRAVAGHCHVAPGRKTDPGACFDWLGLRARYPDLEMPPQEA